MSLSMRPFPRLAAAVLCCFPLTLVGASDGIVHHDLRVRLEPASHEIAVEDRLGLPAELLDRGGESLRFVLHADLELAGTGAGYRVEELTGTPDATRYGINEHGDDAARVPLREYRLVLEPGAAAAEAPIAVAYKGRIHHPLVSEAEEYARSFSRTPGIIDEQGVVLSGSSWWLPTFGRALVSFRLDVDLPEAWDAVSQGKRTLHEIDAGRRQVTWDSPEPMDEVYLVAAEFTEYSRAAGEVTALAYLREPDPNLAAKYLEATVQYIEMYRKLIGPYPYSKFALVENFWDTGYGMPSFTLLGSRIIRFPFILHSSYPHEILHNWWGNSVFVDYAAGNWCEGLTAYLADHLVKEGQGRGAEYRRDTLKKYRNFVRGEKDFPLTEFRARHSSATEAVGYGKSLMLWHMLRRRIGDEAFAVGLQRFYRSQRFRRASFSDLIEAFAAASDQDLDSVFRQWVERSGAPQLELGSVRVSETDDGGADLSIELRQIQEGEPYELSVPVAVTLDGETRARVFSLDVSTARESRELRVPAAPLRVDVDPQFDLFRRLDPHEIPASLGQLFGAERVTIVLPDDGAISSSEWAEFASRWSGDDPDQVRVTKEGELEGLPTDRAVWVLGRGNRWSSPINEALARFNAGVDGDSIRTGAAKLPNADHCFAVVVRNPEDPDLALGWVGADSLAALPGLARKLPHYGKYSFVAFSGDEPTNVAKGFWPVLGSPLVRFLADGPVPRASLPAREPLARLEPVFDPARLMSRVEDLAHGEMEGRGVGTAGLERAIDYVAQAFERAGLEPGGDGGTYFQTWSEPDGPEGNSVTLRNVIGVLAGTKAEWEGQSVVLAAHVDHLGSGWPDVRSGQQGRVYPGADDNASGVAVLLELVELLGRELEPQRSVVFVAFTAEEWGLRGSRHYVDAMQRWPVSKAMAMINLDTVGRLGDGKITVFGTGSATEWIHIVRGIGFTTGIEAQAVAEDLGGSDQKSFHEAGLPAVQIFSGAHEDYHRPSDTVDKIDEAGLVKVAAFVREAVVYLSERERPLTSTLSATEAGPERPPSAAPSGRRVSLGTLPDFVFAGPGVKIVEVLPGTPAEKAGLRPGDLIVAIDGEDVADVRGYAEILKRHAAGDTIRIRVSRDGAEVTVEATLVAR